MAAATCSSYMGTLSKFSMVGWTGGRTKSDLKKRNMLFSISAAQPQETEVSEELKEGEGQETVQQKKAEQEKKFTELRPAETQINVKSKNMSREYGGQWLSSTTRHVRIFAAYIDPVTCDFDQTQMDKLTLILDPTNEFDWTPESCNMVYSYFQDLVDHYEGADLTEYTLRLIGSDIEHYIRKLLYDGQIKYNMNARVLNFSMGKPRVGFSYNGDSNLDDVKQ